MFTKPISSTVMSSVTTGGRNLGKQASSIQFASLVRKAPAGSVEEYID
jgi:hypothetical protein